MSATAAYFSETEFANAQHELAHLRRVVMVKIMRAMDSAELTDARDTLAAKQQEIDALQDTVCAAMGAA